jgi:hypothetical protein
MTPRAQNAERYMVAIGVGVLVGALAGLYFRVVILVPLTILALLVTAAVDVADGLPLRITLLHMVYIWVGLQFGYFGSSFLAGLSQREFSESAERENVSNDMYASEQYAARERALAQVHEAMEVVGSDGQHVGTVDCKRDDHTLILSGDDPKSGGRPHLISVEWIDRVNSKVHLNKPTEQAVSDWQVTA